MKKIFIILVCLYCSLFTGSTDAASISRPPYEGYFVSATQTGVSVGKLFHDWSRAASALCGGDDLVHSASSLPNVAPNYYPYGYLICWLPKGGGSQLVGGIPWMVTCPDWIRPEYPNPAFSCKIADEKPPCSCDIYGDPVIFSSHSNIQAEDDYNPAHRLRFSRFYNSSQAINQLDSMSPLWRHTYSRRLFASQWSASKQLLPYSGDYYHTASGWYPRTQLATPQQDFADITRPDGYGYHFTSIDSGRNWSPDADVNAKLVAVRSANDDAIVQWRLTDENSDVSIYSSDGYFIEMQFFNGGGYVLTYSDAATPISSASQAGLLINVIDNWSHVLTFQYDGAGRMITLIDAAANLYRYAYDAEGYLTSVTYPDLTSRLYYYDEPVYSANASANKGLLTGITDETASGQLQRFATFQYSGRDPISSEHAGGAGRYTFDYGAYTVTDSLGKVMRLSTAYVLGRGVVMARFQPKASGSGTDYFTIDYDDNGNVSKSVGMDGLGVCFQYDLTRNLEIGRVDGVSASESCSSVFNGGLTASERKFTTMWHPTLRLPVSIVGPMRIDERTYDERGNMLTQTLTATSGRNGATGASAQKTGAARVFAFTYDLNGNLLSAKGPRSDVNDTTIYAYDGTGALQSITNPLAQTTTFTNYDGNGRPGRINEANGETTDIAYNPRGWVTSRTVTGQGVSATTSYQYGAVGQLIGITFADNSAIHYGYDAAHRLTDISDTAGNSIHYVLDAAGNRVTEQVVGSTGNLTRQTTRIYNTFNQLSQVTGGTQ